MISIIGVMRHVVYWNVFDATLMQDMFYTSVNAIYIESVYESHICLCHSLGEIYTIVTIVTSVHLGLWSSVQTDCTCHDLQMAR